MNPLRGAGGCTSGHGMSGCAAASPGSVVTTATLPLSTEAGTVPIIATSSR